MKKISKGKSQAAKTEKGKPKIFKSFIDARKRSGLNPNEIVRSFLTGDIRIDPFSRHLHGNVGSLKVGRYVESALYDGAKSVTITPDVLKKIYNTPFEKIK